MKKLALWSIPIIVGEPQALARYALKRFNKRQAVFLATPNPEIMLNSRQDRLLRKILQQTDLNIADGTGLVLALRRKAAARSLNFGRVAGVDFMQLLISKFRLPHKILLLGGRRLSVIGAAKKLSRAFRRHTFTALPGEIPEIRSLNAQSQNLKDFQASPKFLKLINKEKPTVLFVGLGSPLQEKWLKANLPLLPSVRLAMGVGGAFDLISGLKRRAPFYWRWLGFEWLWRLLNEPRRIRRVVNALIVFPIKVLLARS